MRKYFLIISVLSAFMLGACDQNNSSNSSGNADSVVFNNYDKTLQLPVFEAKENSIEVNWYSVTGATEYELFWEGNAGQESARVSGTSYVISTVGYETFQVWLLAFDAQGDAIASTEKVTMSSLDVQPVTFSDVAPE
jgi:uncharacterized protein YcfL